MTEEANQLRVAHVAWGYLGGGVDSVLDSYLLADKLHPERVVSHVVIIRSPDASEQKLPKASGGCSLITRRSREIRQAARDTADCLRDFSPDVVLLHGFNATILGLALQRYLPSKLPVASSYHGQYFAVSLWARAKSLLFNLLELKFFRSHAAAVIAVSRHSAAQLAANRVPMEKIVVLHNAVDLGSPPVLPRTHSGADGKHGGEVRVISVSRLAPQKGIEVLLRAFAEVATHCPTATLHIVGDGPLRDQLAQMAKALSISEAVKFLGNRRDVADLLGKADIFAMTSRQEDHSVSILEAMRAGLPLVVTDVGGNAESVRDATEGYLVPDLDERAAAAALLRLVTTGELRARLGRAARTRYEDEFESAIMIDRYLTVLKSLVQKFGKAQNG